MTRLLDKTLKIFIRYAALVLLCSVPAYYLITDIIWAHELKEHNRITSETIKQNLQSLSFSDKQLTEAVNLWNKLRPETKLQPAAAIRPDSTYNFYRRNRYIPQKGYDRFQGLATWFLLNDKPYRLLVETNMEESYETIVALGFVTFVFFVILVAGLTYLNKRISRKLWQPFYESIRRLQSFDLHQQHPVTFDPTTITEFQTLNRCLDKLIQRNIAVYKQQKEFTQNASHELQTPLAIVKFKLDLLHQSHSLTADQSDIIEQAHLALSRVTHLNKNLLLLAKIENSQFQQKEPLNISALVKDKIQELQDLLEDKRLTVIPDIQPHVTISSNNALLDILLNNLLMNAIRHSETGAHLRVTVNFTGMVIANPGTMALDEARLFHRFSATPGGGTGLGLAIVQQISRLNGWQSSYSFKEGWHRFEIKWDH